MFLHCMHFNSSFCKRSSCEDTDNTESVSTLFTTLNTTSHNIESAHIITIVYMKFCTSAKGFSIICD